MKQETLFTLDTPYRQKLDVEGFRFGKGTPATRFWSFPA